MITQSLSSLLSDLAKVNVFADDPEATPDYRVAILMMRERYHAPLQWKANREKRAGSPYKAWVDWVNEASPAWTWNHHVFRINPSFAPKRLVQWDSGDDVPMPLCWVRLKDDSVVRLVLNASLHGVALSGVSMTYPNLFEEYEHSTTGRAPWLPCGKYVVA